MRAQVLGGPQAFGKYLLLERIAAGGMAEVFRAVHQGAAGVEKTVALKRILPLLHGSDEFVQMFIDEARIACSLTHVNVAQVLEFGEVGGTYYLAMELIEGADLGRLADAARRRGLPLPHPIVAMLAAEAARGLAYAHEKRGPQGAPLGIVHRDVSPQNVLVSYAGEVKIADFGIAKAASKLHRTESGAVMGKLRYMSPEQITGEPLDARSDLFSLGAVLWELCTGRQLFDGDNPGRVSDQVKSMPIAPPSSVRPDVPAELDRICLKALERARDARYQRAADLARDLSTFVGEKAPSLTREDVGALVQELVPPAAIDPDEAQHAPTVPAALSPAPAAEVRPTPPAGQPTAPAHHPGAAAAPPQGRRLALIGAGGVAIMVAVLALSYRALHAPAAAPAEPPVKTAPPPPVADLAAGADGPRVDEAERARLLGALRLLPRESVTRRGVASEDYLALMSAVDAALCASGGREPVFPPDVQPRLATQKLEAEAQALARYLLATGELPPDVAAPLKAFWGRSGAFRAQPPGWSLASLAAWLEPDRPRHLLDLLRQNGALRRWREPAADGGPREALCDRRQVVARYATLEPGARAEALSAYLQATPAEAPVEHAGLRWQLLSSARDEAAARLELTLQVHNPGGAPRPVPLASLRLRGLADPPQAQADPVGPGQTREVRVVFSGLTDAIAEAAVLELGGGDAGAHAVLQAYSELLR